MRLADSTMPLDTKLLLLLLGWLGDELVEGFFRLFELLMDSLSSHSSFNTDKRREDLQSNTEKIKKECTT